MNPDLQRLQQLQVVDGEIAALKSEIAALPKRVQQIEAKLASAQKRVEDAKAAIKANETARRGFESDIQSENTKIIKFREQSSSVKTNEQYKALLQEISHAEKKISGFEEKILEAMVALDGLHEELKAAEAALKADSVVIEKEKAAARERTAQTEKELAEATARRNELRSGINPSLLAHYERVAKGRGTGLAEALNQRCLGCQVMLRAQVYNNILNGEVESCDSCSRILYHDPAHADAPVVDPAAVVPQVHREWMYVPSLGPNGAFVIFINAKGNATLKAWDARTGAALEKRTEKHTTFEQAFANELKDARNLFVDEANVEERYKDQLPEEMLIDLQHQIPSANAASE